MTVTVPASRFAAPGLSTEALAAVTEEIAAGAPEHDRSGALPWPGRGRAPRQPASPRRSRHGTAGPR